MANRRPLYVGANGVPIPVVAPDTLDATIIPLALPGTITTTGVVVGGSSITAAASQVAIGNDTSNGYIRTGTGSLVFQNGDGTIPWGLINSGGYQIGGSTYGAAATIAGGPLAFPAGSGSTAINPPAYTTRSTGTRLLLYPAESASSVDYAIGITSSTLWHSVPSGAQFAWYGDTVAVATLSGAGYFSANSGAAFGTLAAGSTVLLAQNFSASQPVLNNSSEGGMNFGIASTSTLGYRFFKYDGTTLTSLAQITPGGALILPSSITSGGAIGVGTPVAGMQVGDISASRSASQGVIFLGSSGTHYVFYDGASYNLPGGNAIIGGGAQATYGNFGGSTTEFTAAAGFTVIGNDGSNSYCRIGSGALYFQNGAGTASYGFVSSAGFVTGGYVQGGTNVYAGGIISGLAAGDIGAARSGTTGYLFFGSSSRYVGYNGTAYVFYGASLIVNGTTYTSSRDTKHAIAPIAFDSVAKIKALSVVSFRYKPDLKLGGASPGTPGEVDQRTHHGVIAEDSPREFLSPDGKGLEGHTTLAIALDAIKQLTLRIEALEAQKAA